MEKRNKSYRGRAAVIAAIAAMMVAVSVCLYVLHFSRGTLQAVAGQAHLSVMVADDSQIDPVATARLIESIAGVSSARFIDSTDAERDFSASLGIDIASIVGVGAIPSSYIVAVAADGGKRAIDNIKTEIASASWAESVSYEEGVVERTEKITRGIDLFAWWFTVVIVALAVILLYIVARLNVGLAQNVAPEAPVRFLRSLLLRRATVDGVIAGICSAAMLAAGVYCADNLHPALGLSFGALPLIASSVLVGGMTLNLIFTYISTLQIIAK